MSRQAVVCCALILCTTSTVHGIAIPFTATGADKDDPNLVAQVTAFRVLLGDLNANDPTTFSSGRREINWDAVPESSSSPNAFAGNFFNGSTTGRARGIVFDTTGTGFEVSANAINSTGTPVEFGNINPNYPNEFSVFSAQKLFAILGTNTMEITFFTAGDQTTPATVNGFGVIFTDVNDGMSTYVDYYDGCGALLQRVFAPAGEQGSESLSFVGVFFSGGERVARVVITCGSAALGANVNDNGEDIVVMDDFIYGEPQASVDSDGDGAPNDCDLFPDSPLCGASPCGPGLGLFGFFVPAFVGVRSMRRRLVR